MNKKNNNSFCSFNIQVSLWLKFVLIINYFLIFSCRFIHHTGLVWSVIEPLALS